MSSNLTPRSNQWMYSKVVMQYLHTVPIASSNLATSTNHLKDLIDEVVGTFISLKSFTSFVQLSCFEHLPVCSYDIGPIVGDGQ